MGLCSGCQLGWVQKKIKQIICKLKWIESEGLPITTEDSDTVTFSGDGTQTDPLTAQAIGGGGSSVNFGNQYEIPFTNVSGNNFDYSDKFTLFGEEVIPTFRVSDSGLFTDTTPGGIQIYRPDNGQMNYSLDGLNHENSDATVNSQFKISTQGWETNRPVYGTTEFNTSDDRNAFVQYGKFVDQVEAATTTTPFASAADLNAAYPDAFIGFRIIHESAGNMYIKSGENTWSDITILNPVP